MEVCTLLVRRFSMPAWSISIIVSFTQLPRYTVCLCLVCQLYHIIIHSLHRNPVSGAGLEGGQKVGGVTFGRLGDSDGAILGGAGHSKGVALGVAG